MTGVVSSETVPHSDFVFRRDRSGSYAVVFMHGFLDDQHVWEPIIDKLTVSEFETVQFDLAGFGERTGAAGPFTFDRFAADLSAVVDAVGKPFVLVGHSMSAPVVELVAASRPDRALGLILVSPIPMGGARLPEEAIERFRSMGEWGAAEHEAARFQGAPSAPRAEVERIAMVAAKVRPEVVRAAADLWNNGHPGGARPSEFRGPMLLLYGADDPLVHGAISGIVERFGANTTVTEIEKSGHWPHLERSAVVAEEIDRFLASIVAAREGSAASRS
jgi:pimeloyl-ACP methyl ester carboxylesterase